VKKAYHVLCRNCAIESRKCAKCLTPASEQCQIIPPEETEEERMKLEMEMKILINSLSEAKRRTFLRYMNGKNSDKKKRKNKNKDDEGEDENNDETEKPPKKLPTRDELLLKIDKLKLDDKKHDDFYDDLNSDDDDDEDWDSDSSDLEE
jgi:hypothetical protein